MPDFDNQPDAADAPQLPAQLAPPLLQLYTPGAGSAVFNAAGLQNYNDGVPVDANGNPDFGAMARTLMLLGQQKDLPSPVLPPNTSLSSSSKQSGDGPTGHIVSGTAGPFSLSADNEGNIYGQVGLGYPFFSTYVGDTYGGPPSDFLTGFSGTAGYEGPVVGTTPDGKTRFIGVGSPHIGAGYGFKLSPITSTDPYYTSLLGP